MKRLLGLLWKRANVFVKIFTPSGMVAHERKQLRIEISAYKERKY